MFKVEAVAHFIPPACFGKRNFCAFSGRVGCINLELWTLNFFKACCRSI